jgi:hypothetical protein
VFLEATSDIAEMTCELRLIRAVMRDNDGNHFLFVSERGSPLSIDGAQKLIERLASSPWMPATPFFALETWQGSGFQVDMVGA